MTVACNRVVWKFFQDFRIFFKIFSAFKFFFEPFFTFYEFFWRLLASLKKKNAKKPLKILNTDRNRQRFLEGERKSVATSSTYPRGLPPKVAGVRPHWSIITSGYVMCFYELTPRGN